MESVEDEEVVESDNYEPQVISNNPTERIMARRLRIERRVEALRKQKELKEAQEAAGDVVIEPEVEKTPVELQIEKSIELLEKLMIEGEEYVTNVRVATEAREADRRDREGIGKEKLLAELEEEAAVAETMFTEIAERWGGILQYNDPLNINDDIMTQKEKCDELIKQKDGIIATLKNQLKRADIHFSRDQQKQIDDVNSIAKRIENQIIVMRKGYKKEIQMIEKIILNERQVLIETSNKKWEDMYKKRDQEEKNNADIRSQDYWDFTEEMESRTRDFEELYRHTTMQLENDCDELQRELERIKADAIMNSEKLDYNYQILKKREDENLIIRSQQKRRINKLQDIVNSLRKKNNDYRTQTLRQIDKLNEEVRKLSQNILDVEMKADHMATVNNEKFNLIWNMNKKKADELFQRILDIDKVLCEQQLGLVWKAPDQLPNKMEAITVKTDSDIVQQKVRKKSRGADLSAHSKQHAKHEEVEVGPEETHILRKTVKHILDLVADKTGFLIEDQLYEILKPYLEYEQTLVKVDNVFAALNLKDKSDIDLLLEYFVPYMFCPVCNVAFPERPTALSEDECLMRIHEMDPVTIGGLGNEKRLSDIPTSEMLRNMSGFNQDQGTVVEIGPLTVTVFDDNLKGECRGPTLSDSSESNSQLSASGEGRFGQVIPCQYHHPVMISSVYVLRAVKEFLARYHVPQASMPTMTSRLAHKRSTVSRLLNPGDIDSYWQKYTELFPQERIQLWESLLEGLKRYHELLKDRKTTSESVVKLRQQNSELRRVFANYIDKKDIPY